MKLKAYAKINLTLDVTGKREDGYHTLDTVMQTVSVWDELEIKKINKPGIRLFCNREYLPVDTKNTAFRAAQYFFEHCGITGQGLAINIRKYVPSRAGMGGGSADAAAVLHGLNKMFKANLPLETLVELGAGRRLWEAPLCFGECDGALRVRAAVAWRPLTPVRRLTGLFCAALVFLLFAGAPAVPGGVTETDLSRNLTQMEEAPEKVVEELIRRLEEKGDLLSGVSIAAGWWKWEGTGGRIYLETSVGTWRAFRCVLGESGKMGMIQLRQEGRPHDLADCTQFYPVD